MNYKLMVVGEEVLRLCATGVSDKVAEGNDVLSW